MKKHLSKRNVLVLLILFTFLAAWNRGINLLYMMWALLGATLVLAYLLPRHALRGLKASRSVQSVAFEGDVVDLRIRLNNKGWTSRHMVEVVDALPFAAPEAREALSFVGDLPGRSQRSFDLKVECWKRGRFRVGPLRVQSAYPLGIFTVNRNMPNEETEILVYPKVFEVANLPILSASHLRHSGVEALSKVGGGDVFFGTREYRRGDSLKHIHWPSTARHGRLITKEFETRGSTEMTIILDLHRGANVGKEKESTFEYAIKIAASIAKYALARGHRIQLIAYGQKISHIPSASGLSHFAEILEALAELQSDGHLDYPAAMTEAANRIEDGTTALLFFSGHRIDKDAYFQALDLFQAKQVRPMGIFLDRASFLNHSWDENRDATVLADRLLSQGFVPHWIRKGQDLSAQFI